MPTPAHLQLVHKWSLAYTQSISEPLLRDLIHLDESYLRELASIDPADFLSPPKRFAALIISACAAEIVLHRQEHPTQKLTCPHLPTVNHNN